MTKFTWQIQIRVAGIAFMACGFAADAMGDCENIRTQINNNYANCTTYWHFDNATSSMNSATVTALAGTQIAISGTSVCTDGVVPDPAYEYFHARQTSLGSAVSAETSTTNMNTPSLYQSGFGCVASAYADSAGGHVVGEGRHYSASDYFYEESACRTVYADRFSAGGIVADYTVETVSTGEGSSLKIDFSPNVWSNYGNVYPCGMDFDHCDDSTGNELALREQIIVTKYSGGSVNSVTTIIGGGNVSRGQTTAFGYATSIFENDGEFLDDPCGTPPDSETTNLYVTESGTASYSVPLAVGISRVVVEHCFWIDVVPSPTLPTTSIDCKVICFADLNGDGSVDSSDFALFFAAYELGDPLADFDGDGAVTSDDLAQFLAAYELGC